MRILCILCDMGSTLMNAEFAAKSPRFPQIPAESAKFAAGIFSTLMDAEFAAKSPQFPQIPAGLAEFAEIAKNG